MKFMANENFPSASVRRLRDSGYDVTAVVEETPGAEDEDIMKTNDEITESLFDAIEAGDMETVTKITAGGVPVNTRDFLGRTALFEAVSTGNHDIIRLLITLGADVNISEVNSITPLMEAASSGDAEIVNLLLDNGADILITDNFEDTAYDYAVSQGFPEIGELISVRTFPESGPGIHLRIQSQIPERRSF